MIRYNRLFKFILLLCVFIMLCISFLIYYIDNNKPQKIGCEAKLNIITNYNTMGFFYLMFTFDNDEVWLNIRGDVFNNNKKFSIIRSVYFDSIKIKDNVRLKSNKIIISDLDVVDTSVLDNMLPLPFLYENLEMNIFVFPQGYKNGFIFSTNKVHGLYCND